jgi:hypothetical protein
MWLRENFIEWHTHTHWLSFEGAIDAIVASLQPLFAILIEECSSDATASGIPKLMEFFKFLETTLLLTDILPD